ncbi:MAG: pyridoxal phosphate-dependent aminotransferase [Pseudomonadota bacterium]|nr:pyridoxal phosphate-dependent aminotransferase [Pseudomonadota bacterium]
MENNVVRDASGLRLAIERMPVSRIREVANKSMGLADVIPLWFGEPDVETPQFIRDAAVQALADGETFYTPNRGVPELRTALAAYSSTLYDVPIDEDRITVTASGMSAMMLAHQLLVEPGSNIVCPTPQWPNVKGTVDVLGGDFRSVPLNFTGDDWELDLDALCAAVDHKTRMIFVNSPGNPTGWVMPKEQQKRLLQYCREQGLWLVADEVYARIVYGMKHAPSFLEHAKPNDRLIVINSFSKPWAMTGWRLGWLTTPNRLGERLEILNEFNVAGASTFVQLAGIVALRDGENFIAQQVARYQKARDYVYERLVSHTRIRVARPRGAFYAFFSIDGIEDDLAFCQELVKTAKVGLVPGSAFGAAQEGWLRLCFASEIGTLDKALTRLEDAIVV